jgi:glycosyltransferase
MRRSPERVKVSIVTVVFNRRDSIEDTLVSVGRQTHSDIEHIVIDGGSDDGTREILEKYRSRIDVLVSEPDRGIYDALNKGIERSSGDVVGFLHADDVFAGDDVVSKIAEKFSSASVEALYGDLIYVSKGDVRRVIRKWHAGQFSPKRLAWGWMPPHPTFYARREVYDRLGAFDTGFNIAADYDCMLRFLARGGVVPVYLPEVMVRMRTGGVSNSSVRGIIRKSVEDYVILRRYGVGGLGTLIFKNLRKVGQFLS